MLNRVLFQSRATLDLIKTWQICLHTSRGLGVLQYSRHVNSARDDTTRHATRRRDTSLMSSYTAANKTPLTLYETCLSYKRNLIFTEIPYSKLNFAASLFVAHAKLFPLSFLGVWDRRGLYPRVTFLGRVMMPSESCSLILCDAIT